jgi:DNA adenine methylase
MIQPLLFGESVACTVQPFKTQLLKWIGNKQRFAHEIAAYFPPDLGTYFEPFLGSGAVLGTLAPRRGVGADGFKPLAEIWRTLRGSPSTLKTWYSVRYQQFKAGEKVEEFEKIKAAYNVRPNGADLLFLCRSCYGGVVRFRQRDGYCSTPCGIHDPIHPDSFNERVDLWHRRTSGAEFFHANYEDTMRRAERNDLIYCDPPYKHSQAILYGAQTFSLKRLFHVIAECKSRGVYVALSIDGTKRTGTHLCHLPIPQGLFEREIFVNCGRSMLRRFQMAGESLENEVVHDRLLLTY